MRKKQLSGMIYFLMNDIPPSGTKEWEEWKRQVESFTPSFSKLCIEVLKANQGKTDYPIEAYAATIALRIRGYESYGKVVDGKWVYTVKGYL